MDTKTKILAEQVKQLSEMVQLLMGQQGERLYTVKETADSILCCSYPTVYKLINTGKLHPVQFYSDKRIKHSDIQAYIDSLPPAKR